jgi:hypothetical protein
VALTGNTHLRRQSWAWQDDPGWLRAGNLGLTSPGRRKRQGPVSGAVSMRQHGDGIAGFLRDSAWRLGPMAQEWPRGEKACRVDSTQPGQNLQAGSSNAFGAS